MSKERNKEMDLLLRRLSRSASASPNDGHLDADELSSYAENALPAAARARYTEHLAVCASCRKLVAQLSSSVTVVTAPESAKISAPSGLRKFLAGLFSPMVLRYAVPALGLIVVAVIGLTVFRRNERAESVAQLRVQDQGSARAVQPQQAQSPSSGLVDNKQEKVGSPSATPANRPERANETTLPPPPNAPPAGVSVTAEVNQASPTPKVEQQVVANEPAPPKPTPVRDDAGKVEAEGRRQETQDFIRSETQKKRAYEPAKDEDRGSASVAAARAPARTPAPGSIAVQRSRIEEKDKSDADTRSVAGRRFRKEHGVWIDTGYDSSTSTVSLTRGSEQYRALVADEPAIKTIAEQLDGEIIIVWKGHAYRIR